MEPLLFIPIIIIYFLSFVTAGVIMKIFSHLLLILISFSFSQEAINYETTLIEKDHLFLPKTPINPTLDQYFLYMTMEKRKKKEVSKMEK